MQPDYHLTCSPYSVALHCRRYFGNNRSMLMPNCLFRVGGAAMLLTNRRREALRSKYELMHTVRTHIGANDSAYNCIFQQEDEGREVGVTLSRELLSNAGEALKVRMLVLGCSRCLWLLASSCEGRT